jgi:DNA-binding NtrC family response regulator
MSEGAIELLSSYNWPGNVRELQNICERAVVLSDPKASEIHRATIEPWLMESRPMPKAMPLRASGSVSTNGVPTPSPAPERAFQPTISSFAEPKMDYRPGDKTLAEIEREEIVATLKRFNGHRQKTAKALGIGVRTLGLKLKKWKEDSLVSPNL